MDTSPHMEMNSDELLQETMSLRENYSEYNDDTLRSLSPDHPTPGIIKNQTVVNLPYDILPIIQ